MNRFTCLLALPPFFFFFKSLLIFKQSSQHWYFIQQKSIVAAVSIDLYDWAPVESCHGTRGKTFSWAGVGPQLYFARLCQGFQLSWTGQQLHAASTGPGMQMARRQPTWAGWSDSSPRGGVIWHLRLDKQVLSDSSLAKKCHFASLN